MPDQTSAEPIRELQDERVGGGRAADGAEAERGDLARIERDVWNLRVRVNEEQRRAEQELPAQHEIDVDGAVFEIGIGSERRAVRLQIAQRDRRPRAEWARLVVAELRVMLGRQK